MKSDPSDYAMGRGTSNSNKGSGGKQGKNSVGQIPKNWFLGEPCSLS
jgi:hypothetical protein